MCLLLFLPPQCKLLQAECLPATQPVASSLTTYKYFFCERMCLFDTMQLSLFCIGRRPGVIRRGMRWNAVPIVEKLTGRRGTAFPLLKCLRTHYVDCVANRFPAKNALSRRILHIQSLKIYPVVILRTPKKRPWCLDLDTISA